MEIASIIISTCALLFTVFSFWWMSWRRGKLNCGPINYLYMGTMTESSHERGVQKIKAIGIPLILWNSGASPLIVHKLRLCQKDLELTWDYERSQNTYDLSRPDIEADYFSLPLSLKANEICSINTIFNLRLDNYEFIANKSTYTIQAIVFGSSKWVDVSTVTFDSTGYPNDKIEYLNTYCKLYVIN
ncbi:hypothetical protein [Aeromonas hydrophila]|uniref:hypothetical protein n=1 Tax=Aeromonas hydrophila TaxID=644 RepID=UPI000AE5938C|nr:hypothetical protein [Aeromonas hydrophila]